MTFANNSFDTVISTDVLEHIPLLKKIDFVRECLRVARDYVIIAAPFDTDAVDSAEHATNDFNKQLFNQGQSWLEEHFEYKKPSLEKILRFIEKEGYEVEVVGSNNIYNWVLSTHLNLIEAKLGLGNKKLVNINKTINKYLLLTNDMTPPFYRHFIVISKNKLTGSKKERIAALRNPTINYDESVAYIHNLLSLVSDKIRDSQTEFKQLEQTRNIEISYLKKEIDNMRHELADKQSIIDKCRPYLYLLRANPVSKVRRAIKSKKQIS